MWNFNYSQCTTCWFPLTSLWMVSMLNGQWQSFRVQQHGHTPSISNRALPLIRLFLSTPSGYFSHSFSCSLIELGIPWTMVITLPEAITIKRRWPEMECAAEAGGCLPGAHWGARWHPQQKQPEVLTQPGRKGPGLLWLWGKKAQEALVCFYRIQTRLETLQDKSKFRAVVTWMVKETSIKRFKIKTGFNHGNLEIP